MDVTCILEADHRDVEHLFARIEEASGDARKSLVDELSKSLGGHMQLEESVVYPAMAPVTGPEPVEEGETEHELARKNLAEVLALAPDEPGFGAALAALKAAIEHHVNEEEDEIFPQLRKAGESELAEMATLFMTQRVRLGLPLTADALASASSKSELAEEARSAGIDGASSMNKVQLAEALADNMA